MAPFTAEETIGSAECVCLERYDAAYSENIQVLIHRITNDLHKFTNNFIFGFQEILTRNLRTSTVLGSLAEHTCEHLSHKHADYLVLLMSPDTTPKEHFGRALEVGRTHEMMGVPFSVVLDAYGQYQQEIKSVMAAAQIEHAEQLQIEGALLQRLMLDIEAQLRSYQQAELEISELLTKLNEAASATSKYPDHLSTTVQLVAGLRGICACLLLHSDMQDTLRIESIAGVLGHQCAQLIQKRFNLSSPTGIRASQGPVGRAWRTGAIATFELHAQEGALNQYQEAGLKTGIQSWAVVPLLDETGTPFSLLLLSSGYPQFFETFNREMMLGRIQQILNIAMHRREPEAVVTADCSSLHCGQTQGSAVEMLYQPIVDLGTGRLTHIEALARLRGTDQRLIEPKTFLPTYGKAELLHLFQCGLACIAHDWPRPRVPISLNLPAEGLIEDAYCEALFHVLGSGKLEARWLRLEILESQEPANSKKRDARIEQLRKAGLTIVQDDLGSGHSSLLRMNRIDFDAVKIDQGLVRSAAVKPQRALEFIYHLTRLAHGFGVEVTVEGLENAGLIEAAAILGADHGQGYGIARPMPAREIEAWAAQFVFTRNVEEPSTPLGALAGYLLWDQQLAALTRWPMLIEDFVRSPCVVRRFLDHSFDSHDALRALLAKNHACALHGPKNALYQRTRNALIDALADLWLMEMSRLHEKTITKR